jgi:4-amino-4-deoxy-L-arabinose transferase-like glycosyltransferase
MERSRFQGSRWLRLDVVVLSVVVAVAAFVRLLRLDLMEFKADEANVCALALHALGYTQPGVGKFFPTEGILSSVGIPNPPLFVYLVALPLAVVRSPIAAAAFIAATNVFAVWLCYLVGTRYYSRFVGIASAALFALSPWAIVFSRKIWSLNVLPMFSGLFLLALRAFLVERRSRAVFWLIVLVAGATQIHASAWILVPVLLAALVIGRDAIDWRWLSLGLTAAVALYAPFLIFHGEAAYDAAQKAGRDGGMTALDRFEKAAGFTLAIPGGDNMSFLLGSQSALAHPLSLVLGGAAFVGLLLGFRQWRASRLGSARALLAVWYVLPVLMLTALQTPSYIHYFVILFPLPFLGIALVLEQLCRRRVLAGWLALAGCLCCFAYLDGRFFQTIFDNGGAPGDYGVAYRYTEDAAAMFVRENPGRSFEIGTNGFFAPGRDTRAFSFLVWNRHPDAPAPSGAPAVGYVVVHTFTGTPPVLAGLPNASSYPTKRFGPLEVISIPK